MDGTDTNSNQASAMSPQIGQPTAAEASSPDQTAGETEDGAVPAADSLETIATASQPQPDAHADAATASESEPQSIQPQL